MILKVEQKEKIDAWKNFYQLCWSEDHLRNFCLFSCPALRRHGISASMALELGKIGEREREREERERERKRGERERE